MSDSLGKICVVCKQDCSKKPRTKDSAGHYTCAECAKKTGANATKPRVSAASAASPPASDDDAVMGALLAGVTVASTARCENCGTVLSEGAVLCVRCGYDTQTGRVRQVKITNAPKDSTIGKAAGGLAGAGGALARSDSMSFMLGIVLSCVGGILAALLWTYIAGHTEQRIRLLGRLMALLVGVGAGGGMYLGARHVASVTTGFIAAVIAICSCIGAEVMLVKNEIKPVVDEVRSQVRVTDEYAIAYLGQSLANSHEFVNVSWPEEVEPAHAWTELDFPPEIWKAAEARYASLDTQRKADHREVTQRAMDAEIDDAIGEVVKEGVAWAGFITIIVITVSAVIAFRIGSQES